MPFGGEYGWEPFPIRQNLLWIHSVTNAFRRGVRLGVETADTNDGYLVESPMPFGGEYGWE